MSATSSPQPVQRRRATTQTIPRRHRTSIYQQCLQVPKEGQQQAMVPASTIRPVSWHPSGLVNVQQHTLPNYEAPYHSSLGPYNTYSINGMPTPMTQAELGNDISSPWRSLDDTSSLYQSSYDYQIEQRPTSLRLTTDPQQRESYFGSHLYTSPYETAFESCPVFSPVPYPASAFVPSRSSYSTQTAPPTPEFLPIQNSQESQQPTKGEKELVGMGLYDGPDRHSWSLESMLEVPTSLLAGGHRLASSGGKGLKLEETWEPPEEGEESEAEEEEDLEGMEEEEEEELEQQQQAHNAVRGQKAANEEHCEMLRLAEGALGLGSDVANFAPTATASLPRRSHLTNMSNHSFLLDDNDTLLDQQGLWYGQLADYCVH